MKKGFTLVEMSLVLVVIGLIVGSILGVKTLVRNAELRAVISDLEKYNNAVVTYQAKYQNLPGDAPDATNFWGAAGGNSSDNYIASCEAFVDTINIGARATCNGNGNGLISGDLNSCNATTIGGTVGCDHEQYRVWHQLKNAGLIEGGPYVGARSGKNGVTPGRWWVRGYPGSNMPSSKRNRDEGFFLQFLCNPPQFFLGCSHYFMYGAQNYSDQSNFTDYPVRPAFTVEEARSIDLKLDDGRPGTGTVRTLMNTNSYGSACASSDTAATATYNNSAKAKQCALFFEANFMNEKL